MPAIGIPEFGHGIASARFCVVQLRGSVKLRCAIFVGGTDSNCDGRQTVNALHGTSDVAVVGSDENISEGQLDKSVSIAVGSYWCY